MEVTDVLPGDLRTKSVRMVDISDTMGLEMKLPKEEVERVRRILSPSRLPRRRCWVEALLLRRLRRIQAMKMPAERRRMAPTAAPAITAVGVLEGGDDSSGVGVGSVFGLVVVIAPAPPLPVGELVGDDNGDVVGTVCRLLLVRMPMLEAENEGSPKRVDVDVDSGGSVSTGLGF